MVKRSSPALIALFQITEPFFKEYAELDPSGYVYIYIYIYTYTHTHIYIYMHMHMNTHSRIFTYIYIRTHVIRFLSWKTMEIERERGFLQSLLATSIRMMDTSVASGSNVQVVFWQYLSFCQFFWVEYDMANSRVTTTAAWSLCIFRAPQLQVAETRAFSHYVFCLIFREWLLIVGLFYQAELVAAGFKDVSLVQTDPKNRLVLARKTWTKSWSSWFHNIKYHGNYTQICRLHVL